MQQDRTDDCARINLYRRNGDVAAVTLVDHKWADRLNEHRWHLTNHGYAGRSLCMGGGRKRLLLMHRVILGLDFGDPLHADHINGDKLDNRSVNLRAVTHAQNHQNRKSQRGSTSKYRGVFFEKRKKSNPWRAYGCVNGKITYLGYFATEELAAEVAAEWRREHMPYATN